MFRPPAPERENRRVRRINFAIGIITVVVLISRSPRPRRRHLLCRDHAAQYTTLSSLSTVGLGHTASPSATAAASASPATSPPTAAAAAADNLNLCRRHHTVLHLVKVDLRHLHVKDVAHRNLRVLNRTNELVGELGDVTEAVNAWV